MDVRRTIAVLLVVLAVANASGQALQDWPTWRARTIALVQMLGTNVVADLDRFVRGFTKWCDFEPGHIRAASWADMSTWTWAELEFTNPVVTLTWEETEP